MAKRGGLLVADSKIKSKFLRYAIHINLSKDCLNMEMSLHHNFIIKNQLSVSGGHNQTGHVIYYYNKDHFQFLTNQINTNN